MSITASLMGAIRKDQSARWQDGDAVPVEAYLEQHPSLQTNPADVLDLVYRELALRQERGEAPQLAEYLERFSQFDRHLRALFESPRTQIISSAAQRRPSREIPSSPTSVDLPSAARPLQKTVDSQCDGPAAEECRTTIPGYDIVRELGRGAMGVVYQARQHSLKRQVAVKMLLAGQYAGPTMKARFRTEAEAVARLQHPNIVPIYEVAEHDGWPFLCLEYVDGGSLQHKVAAAALSEPEAARMVQTLARAIHYTHERGILHRDLKPNNILLTADGVPKITDFGLAKLVDADDGPTRTESVLGTPNYMSPEQAAGQVKKIGRASDIYSLGAILYELLTGRVPFQGTTLLNTLEQVRTREPVPPRRLQSHISLDLQTICLKCLEKDPAKRYASGAALADDLGRFLDGASIQARPTPLWQRLWRSARRWPARVASGFAVAAVLCLFATACWYSAAASQLKSHRAEEKRQTFIQRRNDAMFYGLLSPDQGMLLSGADAATQLRTAETAARDALALAGIDVDAGTVADGSLLHGPKKDETAADCYALLLVLASVRGQQARGAPRHETPYRESLRYLDLARQLGFETRAYHLRRAYILEQMGGHDEARQDRDRADSLPLKDALDHFLVGEECYRRGDWAEAAASFNRALEAQPSHFWAQFFAAICHLTANRCETAKTGLTACIARQPGFAWTYLFRSVANEKLHNRPAAEADFHKALSLNLDDDGRYFLYQTRGILHFKNRDWQSAAADFRAAQALKPVQYNAYMNLAHVHLAQGQFVLAEELFDKAMRLNPPDSILVGYHIERGENQLREKHDEEALQASATALELDPRQPRAHEVRARALLALGRFAEAEEAFDECLRYLKKVDKPDIFRGRGHARMRLGKYLEAGDDYTRALELAKDADIYQHRGWAHFFSDGWKLALRDFTDALATNPNVGDAYTGHGLASVMLGDYRTAVADAESALNREPSTPEMMHNIACIFALAAVRVDADLEEANRRSLAESARDRAVDALRRTLDMTPPEERRAFWQNKIAPDAALASIRTHSEYERLRQTFGLPRH